MLFRAAQRLRLSRDIRAVREKGRRIEAGVFTLWHRRRSEAADESRVCVIASTSAVGGAVSRARAKRRMRELFRRNQNSVPVGNDLLMIARRAVLNQPWSELENRFLEVCAKLPTHG